METKRKTTKTTAAPTDLIGDLNAPDEVLAHLRAQKLDVVAPLVVANTSKQWFYDTASFRWLDGEPFGRYPLRWFYAQGLVEPFRVRQAGGVLVIKPEIVTELELAGLTAAEASLVAHQAGYEVMVDPRVFVAVEV